MRIDAAAFARAYNTTGGRGRPLSGGPVPPFGRRASQGDTMRAILAAALATGLIALGGTAGAQDKKSDPTGTWKWTTEFGGQKRESTLKLKLEGDKLTGTLTSGGKDGKPTETKIEDGKVKDGEVTFTVSRERNNMKFVTKYKAKVDGDTMKGETESDRDGKTRKQEFEAKRVKDDK